MKTATAGLMAASGEVIDNHDQYEVSFTTKIRRDMAKLTRYLSRFSTYPPR